MCLAIPGQVIEAVDAGNRPAKGGHRRRAAKRERRPPVTDMPVGDHLQRIC
jgi:hypothetical protein